jgi:lysyl-tRNA synthetase class 2
MLKRVMGKASFASIQDVSGRIQIFVSNDITGEEVHKEFKGWDLGDIVGCEGTLFKTKTGELTIQCSSIRLLTKSLRPLPEKFHGLTDVEQKYRSRELDLITNEQTRFTFVARSRMIQSIRNFMMHHGFLEVETPMMHPIPGGAAAKPFTTHHNALDMELFLRIAPELYLKRLVVGGFEKVFEVNRNFRNEGLSPRHNPEFTMMEFYEAYSDYRRLMDFTEGLLRHSAREALGTEVFEYQGRTLDLSKPFARLTIVGAIHHYHPGYSFEQLNDAEWIKQKLKELRVDLKAPHLANAGLGTLQLVLFEETTEAELWDPTYIIDYPAEVSPLARASDSNPAITERFELFIVGREIANGFSELNDPEDQAARFMQQAKAKEAGDEEAMYFDADYIRALEYGLPPYGRLRHRHRPSGNAAHRLAVDPRRHPVPADAPRMSFPLIPAELAFAGDGTPFSPRYGDIYHSSQGGLEQARHVFLAGNDLPARWAECQRFVILETGFGLGLNFLATLYAWRAAAGPSRRRLHYVAVEKHPFRLDDLKQLHQHWPELAPVAAELHGQWPLPLPGLHRLDFGDVSLTLAFGDCNELLPQLVLVADAIYLDGFAPDRNPDLWSEALGG